MNIEELEQEHPALVEQIATEARAGMLTQTRADTARDEAVAVECARLCGLVFAVFGEESGGKFAAVAAKGLTAEDVTSMGISLVVESSSIDLESRKAILYALINDTPEGLRNVQPPGEQADRAAAVSIIAAGGRRL